MNTIDKQFIYALGDTHTLLYDDLLSHFNMKDFVLIHVGDSGEGYHHHLRDRSAIKKLDDFCKENNGQILTTRGNHANPDFYFNDKHWTKDFQHVTFVKDYSRYLINGKVFLFAGGATSIDRTYNIENISWWRNEKFFLPPDYEKLEPCDVLVTHSSPLDAYPYDGFSKISGWFKNDPTLKQELIQERQEIRNLVNAVNPKINIYGHFHESVSEYVDHTWYRCLDINEILDLTNYLK